MSLCFGGFCTFLCVKPLLVRRQNLLLLMLFMISLAINGVAFLQYLAPQMEIHSLIFKHYGGALEMEGYEAFSSRAELMVLGAGRHTSIFQRHARVGHVQRDRHRALFVRDDVSPAAV